MAGPSNAGSERALARVAEEAPAAPEHLNVQQQRRAEAARKAWHKFLDELYTGDCPDLAAFIGFTLPYGCQANDARLRLKNHCYNLQEHRLMRRPMGGVS